MTTQLAKRASRDVALRRDQARLKESNFRLPIIIGFTIIVAGLGGLVAWAATAPLASAVVAPGSVIVESNRKVVQHLEGGIVKEVLVHEGDRVEAGEVLVRLDDTEPAARLSLLRSQLASALAQRARLVAERDDAPKISFPDELADLADAAVITEVKAAQRHVFEERRGTVRGQIKIAEQRIEQLRDQINGLTAARDSAQKQIRIYSDELVGLRELYEKGYYPRTRILASEREVARLEGDVGSNEAGIARAHTGIGEAQSQILQVKQQFKQDVVKELSDVEDRLRDLRERIVVAEDAMRRTLVRSPATGVVQEVRVHTVGGVIGPGQDMMQIVPVKDRLVVEAQVSPTDVDAIVAGQEAEVRFPAFNARMTPVILGKVARISADRIDDQQRNRSFYLARVVVSDEELTKLGSEELRAGMPAEIIIKVGERTALNYVVKPLTDAMVRAFKEQ